LEKIRKEINSLPESINEKTQKTISVCRENEISRIRELDRKILRCEDRLDLIQQRFGGSTSGYPTDSKDEPQKSYRV